MSSPLGWSFAAPCSPSQAAWISPRRCCWWTSRSSECPAAPTATHRGWWDAASGSPQEQEVNKEQNQAWEHCAERIIHLLTTPNENIFLIFAALLAKSLTLVCRLRKYFVTEVNLKCCYFYFLFFLFWQHLWCSALTAVLSPHCAPRNSLTIKQWWRYCDVFFPLGVNEVWISVGGTLSSVCSSAHVHYPAPLLFISNKSLKLLPDM